MFQTFQIIVTFSLRKREEDAAKGRVDNFGRKHGYEGAKTMKMQCSYDVPGQFCEIHMKRNMGVLERLFQGV